MQPTRQPTTQPTLRPFSHPSSQPSKQPVSHPSARPTHQPTNHPTAEPSRFLSRAIIHTVAGTGIPGTTGDGGPAALSLLDLPQGVDIDGTDGSVYISDTVSFVNHRFCR